MFTILKLTVKGALPYLHWYMMVPMLHRSALPSYGSDSSTSGAMYRGDPHTVCAIASLPSSRANPKSANNVTIQHSNRPNGLAMTTEGEIMIDILNKLCFLEH